MFHLLDFLFPPRTDEVLIRDMSVDNFIALVAPCMVDYTRPGTVALLPFHSPLVRAALHEAKYHGSKHAFRLLGAALAEYLSDSDEQTKNIALVPVPLGAMRAKERGYNQVHEVLKRIKLDLPIDATLLTRTRETTTQVGLPREKRERNMRGAFLVSPNPAQSGRRRIDPAHTYIVIDDVITTGATLQAAVDALKAAGAQNIIPLALAH